MKLLAFSGKKQSGKDSSAKYLIHYAHVLFPMVEHETPNGGGRVGTYHLPCSVKTFYFGQGMKDFATDYLGLDRSKVWGTDAQKNELTHIKWENLPHYGTYRLGVLREGGTPPTGFMTVREVLQQIGEEMFLSMNPKVWTNKFKQEVRLQQDTVDVGLVADPRKPEQIDTIHELGGKVIRLLRDPYEGADRHISEIALDPPQYDQSNFDAIIDNRQMSVVQTRMQLVGTLMKWGWIQPSNMGLAIEWLTPEEKAEAA